MVSRRRVADFGGLGIEFWQSGAASGPLASGESKNGGLAVNLMTAPLRREKPCVIIRWLVFQTGWQ